MINWTDTTDNPTDSKAMAEVLEYLKSIRNHSVTKSKEWLINQIRNKRVLDIGAVEHCSSFIQSSNWKHAWIKENASYCLGLDILESLVLELQGKGYNVIYMDATSDDNIGELFDVVHIGDVIEHVDNPIKLMQFARRHLKPGGKIIVTTPNPYCSKFIRRTFQETTLITNLNHLFWVTPFMALEIARRSELIFSEYVIFTSKNRVRAWVQKKFPEIMSGNDFTYIFTSQNQGK